MSKKSAASKLDSASEIDKFEDESVLVNGMTDPDWVPIMKRAAAIVTDHGGRTSHAAIVSIQPAKPTQNAFVESFNGKLRDQCLNLYWFRDLADARCTIEDWRMHYNEVRPHRSLNGQPPAVFAKLAA